MRGDYGDLFVAGAVLLIVLALAITLARFAWELVR